MLVGLIGWLWTDQKVRSLKLHKRFLEEEFSQAVPEYI